jgi:hypothetical protein
MTENSNEQAQIDVTFIEPQSTGEKVTRMTRVAFIKRIAAELPAIYELAKTDSNAEVFKDMTLSSQFIDIDDPTTLSGLEYYKSKGAMSEERIQEVMTTPITSREEYRGES